MGGQLANGRGGPADGRLEQPMELQGRGEIRTRRGREVAVGAEERRREAEREPGGVSVPVRWRDAPRARCPEAVVLG